jgi:hypothetical protein
MRNDNSINSTAKQLLTGCYCRNYTFSIIFSSFLDSTFLFCFMVLIFDFIFYFLFFGFCFSDSDFHVLLLKFPVFSQFSFSILKYSKTIHHFGYYYGNSLFFYKYQFPNYDRKYNVSNYMAVNSVWIRQNQFEHETNLNIQLKFKLKY